MRILSWNINGVRTLPQYHPWNTFTSFQGILEHLKADIICFQEMKTSRSSLPRCVALPDDFEAFFSFPQNKGGYSGVAVYADSRTVTPLRAEEGLSGILQPKPPLTSDDRISRSYPCAHEIELMPDEHGSTPSDFAALEAEGRALIVDFGLFVLINVYCPNETSDARLPFKINFHIMLQDRVRKLMNEGREVVVVGDINICATPLDHCDGHLASNTATFYDHPARAWFHGWLSPIGCMTDAVRTFWPGRKGMYTCWNMKISARETNYGTRVDYILVTPGMLPWIKHGDIQPSLRGSDHCPIYIDLHDEITTDAGERLFLRDVLPMDGKREDPPRLAARLWEEYSGKQTLLSTFFGKGNKLRSPSNSPLSSLSPTPDTQLPREHSDAAQPDHTQPVVVIPPPTHPSLSSRKSVCTSTNQILPSSLHSNPISSRQTAPPPSFAKRKSSDNAAKKVPKKLKGSQSKLSSFFAQPSVSPPCSQEISSGDVTDHRDYIESDYQLALELSASPENSLPQGLLASAMPSASQSKAAWSQLMAPVQPPICLVHGEPAKEHTVNKPGPNKGKTFFLCSRPVGPGYDKGKSERLREEVDHRYRCNFFKWTSDVRREAKDKSSTS
ncbi:Endonuclease/exonuclease/phosphatase [Suillus subalutaceus]|uniref:Endonuclease/exonuclease/phosphatase n=1 Tax=Suillus subalutaceus TaxID=48586 RepID=UPI001B874C2E|nr:Endonuclease/exonuclease/phosphatase [Suillus subalutaceus]KAG1841234.1 Endonuclease/exonuclease/phosphatase [Suillus subalutaceus]